MKKIYKFTTQSFMLFILPVLTILMNQNSFAQPTDRYTLYNTQFGETNDFSTSTTTARAAHQMFLDEEGSNLLTIGVNYSRTMLTDENLLGVDKTRELQTIVPSFNLMRIIDEQYSLILTLRPGFYGDMSGGLNEDFRLEGGAVLTKYISDKLTLGLGIARGTNLGRDLVVPLFQFLYFATDKVVVRGLLPVRASAWYIPNQDWEFGLVFGLQGSLYNIDETNIANAEQLGFATANVGLSSRYKIFNNKFLVAETGYTALRRYEWTNANGPSTDIGQEPLEETELDGAPYIKLGFLEKF